MKNYIVEWVSQDGQRLMCSMESKSKAEIKRELQWQDAKKVKIVLYGRKAFDGLVCLDDNSIGIEAYQY